MLGDAQNEGSQIPRDTGSSLVDGWVVGAEVNESHSRVSLT